MTCPVPILMARRDRVSCGSVVFVDQSAEYLFMVDPRSGIAGLMSGVVRWPLLAALVRAMVVVVGLELGQHHAQVAFARDEQVVKAFAAYGADEPLGVRVRSRSLDRRLDDPHAGRGEQRVEGGRELLSLIHISEPTRQAEISYAV